MYVLDTNILVAALWSREGASFELLRRALEGRLSIAVSVALALEYEDVLKRAAIAEASWASETQLDTLLDALLGRARRIMPIRTRLRPILADPGDEMVLECAVQAGADAIVTMNLKDFSQGLRAISTGVASPRRAASPSGRRRTMTNYPLRLPDHVMAEARALATRSGTSLNQFLSTLIAERVGEMKALAHVEARASRADFVAALKVLDHVPKRAPSPGDER